MQKDDMQELKVKFMAYWLTSVQDVTHARATNMSQQKWANLTGRSLKTIQRFEAGKCFDPELMFLYKKAF